MGRRNGLMTTLAAVVAVVFLAGCGGSSDSGGGSDEGASARGPITFVQGKDNSNTILPLLEKWNAAHPNEKVTFKQQSDQADQQLADLEQHFQAKDPGYDVVTVDVVWTAEFAAKGWLQPLKDSFALDTSKLLPATVKAATYNNTLYAAPVTSDGGMLYYRKDLVPTPPKTWDEMISTVPIAKTEQHGLLRWPVPKYEGLTVNAAEAINAAGGVIVDEDGKTPTVDSPEASQGPQPLADGFKQGYIPKEAHRLHRGGEPRVLRGRPADVHAQLAVRVQPGHADGSSKVKGKFGVAPLPGDAGKPGASSLGGHSAAISTYSEHKATALDFLKFLESDESQRNFLTAGLATRRPCRRSTTTLRWSRSPRTCRC